VTRAGVVWDDAGSWTRRYLYVETKRKRGRRSRLKWLLVAAALAALILLLILARVATP
jgi:hypothetical protein